MTNFHTLATLDPPHPRRNFLRKVKTKLFFTILGEESPCGGYDPLGRNRCPELSRAVEGIKYIAEVTKREEDSNKVSMGRGGH